MFVSLLLESEPVRAGAIFFVTPPPRPAMWHIVCNFEMFVEGMNEEKHGVPSLYPQGNLP